MAKDLEKSQGSNKAVALLMMMMMTVMTMMHLRDKLYFLTLGCKGGQRKFEDEAKIKIFLHEIKN